MGHGRMSYLRLPHMLRRAQLAGRTDCLDSALLVISGSRCFAAHPSASQFHAKQFQDNASCSFFRDIAFVPTDKNGDSLHQYPHSGKSTEKAACTTTSHFTRTPSGVRPLQPLLHRSLSSEYAANSPSSPFAGLQHRSVQTATATTNTSSSPAVDPEDYLSQLTSSLQAERTRSSLTPAAIVSAAPTVSPSLFLIRPCYVLGHF